MQIGEERERQHKERFSLARGLGSTAVIKLY